MTEAGPGPGPRRCPNCGASAPRQAARFCERCGAELSAAAPKADPLRSDDVDARLAALEAHPQTARLMEHSPAVRGLDTGVWTYVGALVLLAGAGLGLTIVLFGFCPPLGFLPLALVLIGGYAIVKQMTRPSHAPRLPVERLQAFVADARTKITEGGAQPGTATTYLATLRLADGTRRELEVFDDVAAKISPGDVGVAYVEGHQLVAFERVPV